MIGVPFVYFSILLVFIVRRKKTFDISAYLVSLYLISSFFSIIIDINNLRYFEIINYEIGIVPTFLYCFLLTLTIWPFYKFKSEEIISLKLNSPKFFNAIVYFYIFCFLFISISSYGSILNILTGDLSELTQLREALKRGESIDDVVRGGSLKPLYILTNAFGGYSFIMLLFYFYSICFLEKSKYFNLMILLSSLSIIIIGILGIDRSKTVYWIIVYGLMLVLFWRYMTRKQKKNIILITSIIFTVVFSYLLVITVSRFGEMETGTEGGTITYAGQSFINFCFFYDEVQYSEFSLQRIFPLFYKLFVNNGIDSSVELNRHISLNTGIRVTVFSTFIGDIMVASGRFIAIVYCFIYNIIARILLKSKKMKHFIYFEQLILVFILISVPLLGLFVYFYAAFIRIIPLIFFIIYAFSYKLKRLKLYPEIKI